MRLELREKAAVRAASSGQVVSLCFSSLARGTRFVCSETTLSFVYCTNGISLGVENAFPRRLPEDRRTVRQRNIGQKLPIVGGVANPRCRPTAQMDWFLWPAFPKGYCFEAFAPVPMCEIQAAAIRTSKLLGPCLGTNSPSRTEPSAVADSRMMHSVVNAFLARARDSAVTPSSVSLSAWLSAYSCRQLRSLIYGIGKRNIFGMAIEGAWTTTRAS